MSKTTKDLPKISTSNTKKEMLAAYNQLAAMLEERATSELQPEKAKEEKQKREVVSAADDLAGKGVTGQLDSLKAAIARELSDIAEKTEEQAKVYLKIKEAIAAKEQELRELFEIEKSAFSLAALLEANRQKKEELEQAMGFRREELANEIEETRSAWQKEKSEYADLLKEQKKDDEKRRKREEEEYLYAFKRDKEQKLHALQDELAKLTKELAERKAEYDRQSAGKEKELQEREEAVAVQEKYLRELQKQVEGFPQELDSAVKKAVSEVSERLTSDMGKNEELLRKTFEGELNVLSTKIQSLEQAVTEKRKQLESMSAQLEKAYGKVQDIAIKAVAGAQDRRLSESVIRPAGQEQEK